MADIRRTRVYSVIVASGVIVALLWPLTRRPGYDSYPLSTYPMFTQRRDRVDIHRLVGLTDVRPIEDVPTEALAPIPPRLIGSREVMQAAVTIRRTALRGQAAQRQLCRQVAQRIAADPTYASLVVVALLRERYDPVAYFRGTAEPEARRELTRCHVSRPRRDAHT